MLIKNVYLLYPPGYSGSYVNWCINISDADRFNSTVKNPINNSTSVQYGGDGTSHLHLRIPTHQAYAQHVNWVLLNKPKEPRIYIINVAGYENNYVAGQLLQHDPDGIIINIHHNNDPLIDSYGAINSAIKWPVRYLAGCALSGTSLPYDPFNCANDRTFRNWAVVKEWGQLPLNYASIDAELKKYIDWFQVRHTYHPHEVNSETYLDAIDYTNRIFELSCLDIATMGFLDIFKDIMDRSQCSDRYDLNYVNEFHSKYVQAQKNLQWFDSFRNWQATGELDDYLQSHSIIEAQVITFILKKLEKVVIPWETMSLNEINKIYQQYNA